MLSKLNSKAFSHIAPILFLGLMTSCQQQAFNSVPANNSSSNISSKYSDRGTATWTTCTTQSLQQAQDFNVFVLGDATQPSSDTQGRSAIGGNLYISNYSVGDQLAKDANRIDLLVGGNLTFPSGAVMSGRTVYGGILQATAAATSYGGFSQEDHSADFTLARTTLKKVSADLGKAQANSTITTDFAGGSRSFTHIVGTNPQTNVIGIGTDDLELTHTLTIEAPAGSTMLVNLYGEHGNFSALEMKYVGIDREHTLFNFVDAKSLYITNIAIEASVLAPLADVTFAAGQLNGQFVGGTLYGQGQFNQDPFVGCAPVIDPPVVIPPAVVTKCGAENTWAKFNVMTFGNFTQSGSDTEGRLAVAGTATLSNYAIGQQLSSDANRYDLIANVVNFNGGSIPHGSVAYGTSKSISNATIYGNVVQDPNALNFAQLETQAQTQSQLLGALTANGTTTVQYYGGPSAQITLTGTDPVRNVFTLSGVDLSHANTLTFNISAPSTSTIIVNVSGTSVSMTNFGMSLNGVQKSQILFNFPQATSLQISGISILGSIMAPLANVNYANGQFNGSLVSKSVMGNGQFNHAPFLGCIPQ